MYSVWVTAPAYLLAAVTIFIRHKNRHAKYFFQKNHYVFLIFMPFCLGNLMSLLLIGIVVYHPLIVIIILHHNEMTCDLLFHLLFRLKSV
jgi:hypothetical protein